MSVLRKLGVSMLPLLLLMTSYARSQKKPAAKPRAPASANAAWVESTLKRMTLREKLGQMLMPHYFGVFTSAKAATTKPCCTKWMKTTSVDSSSPPSAVRWGSSAVKCTPRQC